MVQYYSYQNRNLFIRGDSLGRISIWFIKRELRQTEETFIHLPDIIYSLKQAWKQSAPLGAMDHLVCNILSNSK